VHLAVDKLIRSVNALGSEVANHCIVLSIYNSTSLANQLLIMLSLNCLAIHGPTTSSISVLGCSFEYMTIGLLLLLLIAQRPEVEQKMSLRVEVVTAGCRKGTMHQLPDVVT
jgi:hypothetical protein